MNPPLKAVIFDWAWTLVDLGNQDDRRPFNRLFEFLREKGISASAREECYATHRALFTEMIEKSRLTHREANFEPVLRFVLERHGIDFSGKSTFDELLAAYFKEVYSVRTVFPDAIPTLTALQKAGFRLGLISNTTNPSFMKHYERKRFGLDGFFEFTLYSSDFPFRKPHPSIFELAGAKLALPFGEILYVGDNPWNDVRGAQNVGMRTAWINRDREPRPPEIRPDYEIHQLTELLELDPIAV